MVVDCFTFYNELDMLEFRLGYLNDSVDKFVLVESTKTHAGNDKPLFFEENKERFSEFLDKIVHVICEMPETNDSWVRERHQRAKISEGIESLDMQDEDVVFVSDVDEIWDKGVLDRMFHYAHSLEQDFYFYNVETKQPNKWYHAKVCKYDFLKHLDSADQIRMMSFPALDKGGWHFSYFGDEEFISNKIKNFAHQEYNSETFTDAQSIRDKVEAKKDLFENSGTILSYIKVEDNEYLPENIQTLIN